MRRPLPLGRPMHDDDDMITRKMTYQQHASYQHGFRPRAYAAIAAAFYLAEVNFIFLLAMPK